jgi:hypothetical protein
LALAVDQTHEVKEKLELCADNLGPIATFSTIG